MNYGDAAAQVVLPNGRIVPMAPYTIWLEKPVPAPAAK
jgi:hypothetical protein